MTRFQIRFLPEGYETTIEEGQTLLEAARKANVHVGAICGGEGVCGKCRVIVREGHVERKSTGCLTRDEVRRGYVLACQAAPRGDLVVEVPAESRLAGYEGLAEDGERFRDFSGEQTVERPEELAPLVQKSFLNLPEPTLDNPTPDQECLLEAVAQKCPGPIQIGLDVAHQLPRVLRNRQVNRSSWKWTWKGQVTATVGSQGNVHEILHVERGDTSHRSFGLALDVGTTTIVGHLVDLTTGRTREAVAKYNSQVKYGADVISRINYARQPGGAEALRDALIKDTQALVDELVERTSASPETMVKRPTRRSTNSSRV